jgi:hypothetical protein
VGEVDVVGVVSPLALHGPPGCVDGGGDDGAALGSEVEAAPVAAVVVPPARERITHRSSRRRVLGHRVLGFGWWGEQSLHAVQLGDRPVPDRTRELRVERMPALGHDDVDVRLRHQPRREPLRQRRPLRQPPGDPHHPGGARRVQAGGRDPGP